VDVKDLTLLAINWQAGVDAPVAGSLDGLLASLGLPSTSVPEPAMSGLLLTLPLLQRRVRYMRE
jgi:hypothetical protein